MSREPCGLECRCRAYQLRTLDGEEIADPQQHQMVRVRTGIFAGLVGHVAGNEGEDRWVVRQGKPEDWKRKGV